MCRFQRFCSATLRFPIKDTFSKFVSLWKGVCLMTFVIYFALFPMRCRISRFLWKCRRQLNEERIKEKTNIELCVSLFLLLLFCFVWPNTSQSGTAWCSNELLLFFLSFFSLANLIVSVPDASIFVTGTLRSVFAPMDYVLYFVVVKRW